MFESPQIIDEDWHNVICHQINLGLQNIFTAPLIICWSNNKKFDTSYNFFKRNIFDGFLTSQHWTQICRIVNIPATIC